MTAPIFEFDDLLGAMFWREKYDMKRVSISPNLFHLHGHQLFLFSIVLLSTIFLKRTRFARHFKKRDFQMVSIIF
jgi:hypothetical protein